ncbi:hypothetical protein BKA62DRAFT_5601 [Auriculariales sp. MPI-PUGE-AT-0066]|nr:hypothetical protein BKA62DRAFT_5601 [Auriculariales sp. MPI-PUGE-AT-0066]
MSSRSPSANPALTYHGHRRRSFYPSDKNELVELRARFRTFAGAYARTAAGCLAYALTFLKLFDSRFYRIGLIFLALSVMLAIITIFRQRHNFEDFADQNRPTQVSGHPRMFGRAFVTSGSIVVVVTIAVATVEIALLVLVLRMTDTVAVKVSVGPHLVIQ